MKLVAMTLLAVAGLSILAVEVRRRDWEKPVVSSYFWSVRWRLLTVGLLLATGGLLGLVSEIADRSGTDSMPDRIFVMNNCDEILMFAGARIAAGSGVVVEVSGGSLVDVFVGSSAHRIRRSDLRSIWSSDELC